MTSSIQSPKWPSAFTLVELLVVITILVILLALLTPALDKAIYQAELAVCASTQHAAALGAITYTYDYKRTYPWREGVHRDTFYGLVMLIRYGQVWDDRPTLAAFLDINKHLKDPLSPGEIDRKDADLETEVYSDFALWFGWGYAGQKGMFRLGDRFHFKDPSTGRTEAFNALVSDHDRPWTPGDTLSSHPDDSGMLAPVVREDENAISVVGVGVVRQTISTWFSNTARGPIDTNTAFDDGSVRRHIGVEPNAWEDNGAIRRVQEGIYGAGLPNQLAIR